jgi:anti-sigma factor RsiW
MNEPELSCQRLVELVTDYFEGKLTVGRRRRFEEHLASCPSCAMYVSQMSATIRLTGTLREEDISTEARDALLGVMRDWNGR